MDIKAIPAMPGLTVTDRVEFLREVLRRQPAGLDLNRLRIANVARSIDPAGFNQPMDAWSVAEWTNAICGEAGEAGNVAKKLLRLRKGTRGNRHSDTEQALLSQLAMEAADCVCYCDLTLASEGLSLSDVLTHVYNIKSDELGYPFKL